jgi:hypothetical protein
MDPPQPGEDEAEASGLRAVGGMIARLGLGNGVGSGPDDGTGTRTGSLGRGRELIERLGLGEGSRVVDLQVSSWVSVGIACSG